MDYKRIIKSRKLRTMILNLLSFVPDKPMIKLQYRIKTGRKLDLKDPKRFTEKIQWYKIYYKDPLMIKCVDKYEVREYVKSKGLDRILIPCYGVYDSPDDIDWEALPNQFVLKDTLGGGGVSVVIIKDKSSADIKQLKERCREWVSTDPRVRGGGREWPYYSGKKHRILIEKFLDSVAEDGGLIDYKFFCFDGHSSYIYVIADRTIGNGAGVGIFDRDFNRLEVERADERPLTRTIDKPENFVEMREIAEKLAEGFPEARIDLYDQEGDILFGEITFFGGSGYMAFDPDEFDYILGERFTNLTEFTGGGNPS